MKVDKALEQFYHDVNEGKFKPIYILHGEDDFLIEKNKKYLKSSILSQGTEEFNFQIITNLGKNSDNFYDSYNQLPMMATHRLIEISEIDDSSATILLDILKNPNPSTIICISASDVDLKKKSIQELFKKSFVLEFRKPFENQVTYWVKYLAQEHKIEIEDGAIDLIHERLGNNLRVIEKELIKLKEFAGNRAIGEHDVETLVADQVQSSIFKLIDQWNSQDLKSQWTIVEKYIVDDETRFSFYNLLIRHYRIVLSIKVAISSKRPIDSVLSEFRIKSYHADSYIKFAKKLSAEQIIDRIQHIENLISISKKNPHLAPSFAVMNLDMNFGVDHR